MEQSRQRLPSSAWIRVVVALLILGSYGRPGFAQTPPDSVEKPAAAKEEVRWSGNLIQNGSFEEDAGWSRVRGAELEGESIESEVVLDDKVRRTGAYGLRLTGTTQTTKWFGVESEPVPVRPGNSYKLTGWIRTEDVKQEGKQYLNSNLYAQFRNRNGTIILTGRTPVRASEKVLGTKDWTEVTLQFNVPQFAEFVRVGCTLTCTGSAWFDDVGLYEAITESWNRREMGRFVVYYLGDDVPQEETVKGMEAYLESIESMMGVKRKERARYFKYPNEAKKLAMTGNRASSHTDGSDVHSTNWDDRRALVGVLMNPLGSTTELLGRGLAVYCATIDKGGDVHESSRRLAKTDTLPPIAPSSDLGTVRFMTTQVQEAVYGSFVGWLIEKYGVIAFKRVYAYSDAKEAISNMPSRFKNIYEISLSDAEKAWKDFLLSGASKP